MSSEPNRDLEFEDLHVATAVRVSGRLNSEPPRLYKARWQMRRRKNMSKSKRSKFPGIYQRRTKRVAD